MMAAPEVPESTADVKGLVIVQQAEGLGAGAAASAGGGGGGGDEAAMAIDDGFGGGGDEEDEEDEGMLEEAGSGADQGLPAVVGEVRTHSPPQKTKPKLPTPTHHRQNQHPNTTPGGREGVRQAGGQGGGRVRPSRLVWLNNRSLLSVFPAHTKTIARMQSILYIRQLSNKQASKQTNKRNKQTEQIERIDHPFQPPFHPGTTRSSRSCTWTSAGPSPCASRPTSASCWRSWSRRSTSQSTRTRSTRCVAWLGGAGRGGRECV